MIGCLKDSKNRYVNPESDVLRLNLMEGRRRYFRDRRLCSTYGETPADTGEKHRNVSPVFTPFFKSHLAVNHCGYWTYLALPGLLQFIDAGGGCR